LKSEIVEENISYARARGIEQALIMQHGTRERGNYKKNQIYGISFSNLNKYKYIEAAKDYFGEETYVGGIKW